MAQPFHRSILAGVFAMLLLIGSGARGADSGQKIAIEIPLFEGGAGKDFYLQAAREYEKLRPDVTVDLYLDPRIADKMQVRFLEGTFPEITNAGTINYWPLIRNGDVVQLDKYLDEKNWEGDARWGDTFIPGTLELYSENGKHFGLPHGFYAYVVWFNKKMFREHGWTPPNTWDELFALCEKVKSAGIAPMAFQGRYPYYANFIYEHAHYHLAGAKAWEARQYLAPGSISDPTSVEAIRLVRKLAQSYFQSGALGMSHTESQLQFFLGKTAMIPCGSWLKSEMMGKIPDDFELGCFNLPAANNSREDPATIRVATEPFMVMSKSKHPEVAIDFMKFMTSREQSRKFARMQDIPSSVKGTNEGSLSKDLDDLVVLINKAKTSYGSASNVYPEMFQVYQDLMYDAIAGSVAPAELAAKYEARGMAVRDRHVNPDKVLVKHRRKAIAFLSLLGLGVIWWFVQLGRGIRSRSATRPATFASLPRMGWTNVLLFVVPAVLIYSTFVIVPSLRSFSWSLHEWNGLTNMSAMPFKGLLNFKRLLLESDAFWIALNNNLFLMFVVPLFVVPLAMFLAASISRGVRGADVFRVIFFFPNLLGGVAATLLWLHLYNPQGGLVNTALVSLGFESFAGYAWLEPKNLYWALVPISIWGACGFNMVLYLAAMQTIPESYYEAATLDGASKWRQFWTITLPLIWDVLTISIVFLVIGGMKAFETIWLLTNQRPQTDNHVIATRMVQTMFYEFRVGEATAIAVLLFLMVFVGSAATMRGLRRETVEL